jgi:hypothetical protein
MAGRRPADLISLGKIEFSRSLLMDPDEKRVNFQHGDRRNPDDAADCAEKDEYQQ